MNHVMSTTIYNMATRRVEIGPTGETVRHNVRRFREDLRYRLEDVAALLSVVGRPMSKATLSQIETGGRRVDVDDLMALCHVLQVNPNALLLPPAPDSDEPYAVEMTGSRWLEGPLVQEWAEGRERLANLVPPATQRSSAEEWEAWNKVDWDRRIHGGVGGDVPNRRSSSEDQPPVADWSVEPTGG
jgi:transcriptional regulator with XRE-family HTH domain